MVMEKPEMDQQTIINLALAGALSALGWFGREIWGAIKELRDDIHKLEVDLPNHYIKRDEFREGVKELKELFGEVFKKIDDLKDKKADK